MSGTYQLTPESSAFRANLANLVSPLRRVRTRTPFFRLAAHRIPTLWELYRGLLRNSPTEQVKFRVRLAFRQNRYLTSPEETRKQLEKGYKYLDFFKKAMEGDTYRQGVMMRYSDMILLKREKSQMKRLLLEEMDWQLERRNQPKMTGGFIRPSILNVPLPRLMPQPQATSMIFVKRRTARELRHFRRDSFEEQLQDLRIEAEFEDGLQRMVSVPFPICFSGEAQSEWQQPIREAISEIQASQTRDYERANMPFPTELVEQVLEARREKHRNLTRARERERRGEMTKNALKRKRGTPPSWVIATMTPKRRHMDQVSRSLSEVGYVALVKRRLGFKLKNPDAGLELGEEENRPLLDLTTEAIRTENRRRADEERRMIQRLSRK
ncbi:hypothetical protein JR316_0001265 [Psilocybe cubensis]|uniref:Complex 1 LYR protein domain-containing protein n=2 Tax=Psilocybe cubensis TaxID=181762 RepID=A0A8H8CQ35_PSICU|nr:hypothetical protein JR316_0001265 [Psilocybe cubensis]KAH9487196.1 hypothetical protein JR316_0001265 [Psilocybe cubensis]